MKERKILTLNEVLNLNRRPTLQEMVDLSLEDYTMYLYKKGIIKYIPEDLMEYDNWDDYDPWDDLVLMLKLPDEDHNLYEYYDENDLDVWTDRFILNESEGGFKRERGFFYFNENKYYYDLELTHNGIIHICQIGKDGKTLFDVLSTSVGYLTKNDCY